ncbi:hypothetical protein D9611_001866 [Ephemerocybe angulata]|uniref:Conidiation-specific protein 6 n=1 Tax=Ephemerocybe angulata TaxID=980116 RepID=A0A8H5CHM3_9AGAR|nr:hypothetical protein D9611_001866 [Tulosesus angulatus]
MSESSHPKDPSRVASGYKATIHNPNVSEEAKDRAREHLAALGESGENQEADHRVLGGYKATMHSTYFWLSRYDICLDL